VQIQWPASPGVNPLLLSISAFSYAMSRLPNVISVEFFVVCPFWRELVERKH
jgi:hypothetical protein